MTLGIGSGLHSSGVFEDKYAVITWNDDEGDPAGFQFEDPFKNTYLTKEVGDIITISATFCFKGKFSEVVDEDVETSVTFHGQQVSNAPYGHDRNKIIRNTPIGPPITTNDTYSEAGGDYVNIWTPQTSGSPGMGSDYIEAGDKLFFRKLEFKIVDDEGNIKLLYYPPLDGVGATIDNSTAYTFPDFNAAVGGVIVGDNPGVISGLKLKLFSSVGDGSIAFGQLLNLLN